MLKIVIFFDKPNNLNTFEENKIKMKKKIILGICVIALAAVAIFCYSFFSDSNKHIMLYANVEALTQEESELGEACGGCNTEDEVFCCDLIIEGVGGWFLFRD